MNNKPSKIRIILSILALIFFFPPLVYNWFYIPYMWGKVFEFWGISF